MSARQHQALGESLAAPGYQSASQYDTLAGSRVVKMLHQTQVVQVTLHTASDVTGLAHVEGFKLTAPSPPEDVDAGTGTDLAQIECVDHVVLAGIFKLDRATPLHL